jgi:hypothetical protein
MKQLRYTYASVGTAASLFVDYFYTHVAVDSTSSCIADKIYQAAF